MRVLVAGDRPHDRDHARRAALRLGLECAAGDCVSLADLRLRLAREPAIHLVVVCADPDPQAGARAIKAASGQTRQPIYAVTTNGEASVRESIEQAGAAAVWPLDRLREGLLNSAEEIRQSGVGGERRGRLIAVTAALPGSGVTTVATGLAFGLAGQGPVVLAEFGQTTPDLALNIELNARHHLADLIRASDRLDASMIREAAAQHPAGVHILAHAPESLTPEPLTPAVSRDFQILLRSMYDWVVVDAGHMHVSGDDELLRHADVVLVVARLDPPSMRLTRRYLQALHGRGIPLEALMVVANRYGQSGQASWRRAEDVIQSPVRAWISDDPRAVNRGLVVGQPVVQAAYGSRLRRDFGRLAAGIQARFAPAK